MTEPKFPKEERTFETRLLFLKGIYDEPRPRVEIMEQCIEYKLNMSLKDYRTELERSYYALYGADEDLKVLKKASKESN